MNRRFTLLLLSAAVGFGVLRIQSQQPGNSSRGGQAPPTTDAYASVVRSYLFAGIARAPLACFASGLRGIGRRLGLEAGV